MKASVVVVSEHLACARRYDEGRKKVCLHTAEHVMPDFIFVYSYMKVKHY